MKRAETVAILKLKLQEIVTEESERVLETNNDTVIKMTARLKPYREEHEKHLALMKEAEKKYDNEVTLILEGQKDHPALEFNQHDHNYQHKNNLGTVVVTVKNQITLQNPYRVGDKGPCLLEDAMGLQKHENKRVAKAAGLILNIMAGVDEDEKLQEFLKL